MRRGELVGLRWEDIDLSTGELTVVNNVTVTDHATEHGTPKGNRARSMNEHRRRHCGSVEGLETSAGNRTVSGRHLLAGR